MIDELVDRELTRIATALASRSPEPGPMEAVPASRPSIRPVHVYTVAFATVLAIGAALLIALSPWSPDSSPSATEGSRWDWILDGTRATDDPELRVADPGATPQPEFDYRALGVEQTLIPSLDPHLPESTRNLAIEVNLSEFPFIDVGDVEDTATQGYLLTQAYLFRSTGAGHDFEGSPVPAICLAVGGMIGCHEADAEGRDGIISGIDDPGAPAGFPQGRFVVDLWVPRDTAVVVLKLDDGRSYVQRPVAGVAIFVIVDLGTAGIASAEALDAIGETLIFEDFAQQWAAQRASIGADPNSNP